jgi:hypothetical protein
VARRGKILRFPGALLPPSPPTEGALVEVHRCAQPEAMVVRSLFESEGVPVLLRSRLAYSVHPFSVGDQGEVVILVPHREVIRSRLLLERLAPRP